ncbi:hypothetical protein C8Q72DRAFT_825044 [Fomitopsis betulina]|nr:hypothetical protein C8Q72DRAFT_825044 [Fomitopsis betulina]
MHVRARGCPSGPLRSLCRSTAFTSTSNAPSLLHIAPSLRLMLLFRSVFVGSPVALAFVAGLVPSVTAAPWWPMHYVLGAIPPEQMSSIATTQPGFTSTIKPVTSTSILSSAAPDITGTAESVPVGSVSSQRSNTRHMLTTIRMAPRMPSLSRPTALLYLSMLVRRASCLGVRYWLSVLLSERRSSPTFAVRRFLHPHSTTHRLRLCLPPRHSDNSLIHFFDCFRIVFDPVL